MVSRMWKTALRRRGWGVAAMVAALSLGGCVDDVIIAEGGVCRICGIGGGIATTNCSAPRILECVAGTGCLAATGTCERKLVAGEKCDFRPCAEGLLCDVAGLCNPPAALDEPCAIDVQCAGGARCLHGHRGPIAGRCAAPNGGVGASCEWGPRFGDGSVWFTMSYGVRGCGEALVCVPAARPTLDAAGLPDAPGLCRFGVDAACGYAGVCAAPGQGSRGAPCLEDAACESARCSITAPPRAVAGTPGFVCSDSDACFDAPWPGVCLGAEDLGLNKPCSGLQSTPDGAQCGPQLICIDGFCRAWWSGLGEKCEPV